MTPEQFKRATSAIKHAVTTKPSPSAVKPPYGPPRGSMALVQQPLNFKHVPKYRVLPIGTRFGVARRIEGFEASYDLIRDHALAHTAAKEVRTLNERWEQKTT